MGVSPRPSRRTNLALLVLLAGAFLTGWLAFGVGGSPESRVVTAIHGILGLGILVLVRGRPCSCGPDCAGPVGMGLR